MPLWKKTTICAALLVSAPFASETLAQRLSPLTPLPMPSAPVAKDTAPELLNSIFEVGPITSVSRQSRSSNLLKPMAAPGAPIVRVAQRPVFNSSPPMATKAPVRSAVARQLKQPHVGKLQGKSQGKSLIKEAVALAKHIDSKRVTKVKLPPIVAVEEVAQKVESLPIAQPVIAKPVNTEPAVATAKTAVGLTNDFPLAAATPSVVVRSPFVQPGNPNRYLFVIENIGTVDAHSTRVDLRVPAGVVLKQVVADSASSTARHAVVRIDELKAGAKSILEVEVQPTTQEVTFDTSLTLETKRSFHGTTLPKRTVAGNMPAAASSVEAVKPKAKPKVTAQVSFQEKASTTALQSAASNANLSASVEGPVMLAAGETGDFSIVVKNPNYKDASKVVVQLSIPKGLKITTLDREAWINDEDNTISWELTSLGKRQEEAIQYKAVGKSVGQQVQKVTLGMDDVYQGDAKLVTLISQ